MDIEAIGKELAKQVKTQADATNITGKLMKAILESALNAELDTHLGYDKNVKSKSRKPNTRNGYSKKSVKTEEGTFDLKTPRDRDSSFEPKIIPKGKTRLEGFEKNILALYSRGMTTRDIQEAIKDLYHGTEVSHSCLLYTSPSPRDKRQSRMPSSA